MDWIVRRVERRSAGNSVVNKEKHEAGVLSAHIIFGSVPMRGSGCRIQQHPVVLHNLLLFLLFFCCCCFFRKLICILFPTLMNILGSDVRGGLKESKLLMIHEFGANELKFYTNLFWSYFNYRYLMP